MCNEDSQTVFCCVSVTYSFKPGTRHRNMTLGQDISDGFKSGKRLNPLPSRDYIVSWVLI